ncbi:MAG: hypothetical protein HY287_02955 [Planctomycetes bacterium]|nr:hypothetical protein [Planctomycetota bacterium]MBI3833270.1 hypothetical protein [Planctomycetota bacterium]
MKTSLSVSHSRLYCDLYDSVRQTEIAWGNEPEIPQPAPEEHARLRRAFLGRLRFDILLAKTLVLSDNQVLDGIVFLDLLPRNRPGSPPCLSTILDLITRNTTEGPPIEIRARAPRLGDALRSLVVRPNSAGRLFGFGFSSVGSNRRERLAELLPNIETGLVGEWSDIPDVLSRFDADLPGLVDIARRLKEGWSQWIEQADQNRLAVVKYDPDSFKLSQAMQEEKVNAQQLRTTEAMGLVQTAKTSRLRTEFYAALKRVRQQSTGQEVALEELGAIEDWYNRAYHRAIANQHDCRLWWSGMCRVPITDAEQAYDSALYGNVLPNAELPHDFIHWLGNTDALDGEAFRDLFRQGQEHLAAWWERGDLDEFRRGMEPFVNQYVPADEAWVRWFSSRRDRFGWLGAILGLITGGPLGKAVEKLFPEIAYRIGFELSKEKPTLRQIVEHAHWRSLQ